MERLSKYRKSILSVLLALVVFSVCICSTSFRSHGATSMTKTFNVGYAQPYCSETSGYISVMYYGPGDAHYSLYTYFWTIEPYGSENYSTNVFPQMGITITNNYIKLFPWCHSDSNYFVNICGYDSTDNLVILQKKSNDVVSGTPFEHSYSGYTITGYVFGGNAVINTASTLTYAEVPNIIFNSTSDAASMNSYLYQILGAIKDYEGPIYDILGNVQNIYNETLNMSQKLDSMKKLLEEIKAEQEESNTWLGKIWQSIQQLFDTGEDTDKVIKYKDESSSKKNEINELNKESQSEKVNVDSATSDVDANIDYDNMAQYGGVLATVTNNEYILQLILVVVSIAIISYVLFGKR